MNGTDDWTGSGKSTEVNDQAKGAVSNACKVVDGKCALDNEITRQVSGLQGSSLGTAAGSVLTIPRDNASDTDRTADAKTEGAKPAATEVPGLASGSQDAK